MKRHVSRKRPLHKRRKSEWVANPTRNPGTGIEYRRKRVQIAGGQNSLAIQEWAPGSVFNELQLGHYFATADAAGNGVVGTSAIREGTGSLNRSGIYINCLRIRASFSIGYRSAFRNIGLAYEPESCTIRFIMLQIMDDSEAVGTNAFQLQDFVDYGGHIKNLTTDYYKKMEARPANRKHRYKVLADRRMEFNPGGGAGRFDSTGWINNQSVVAGAGVNTLPNPIHSRDFGADTQPQYDQLVVYEKLPGDKVIEFQAPLGQLALHTDDAAALHNGGGQRIIYGIFSDLVNSTTHGPFYNGCFEYMWTNPQ